MHSDTGLWVEVTLFIFTFFVAVPPIAAAIGYAAWKGRPKNFDREMYWNFFELGYFGLPADWPFVISKRKNAGLNR